MFQKVFFDEKLTPINFFIPSAQKLQTYETILKK
jgi:hypothetical protein